MKLASKARTTALAAFLVSSGTIGLWAVTSRTTGAQPEVRQELPARIATVDALRVVQAVLDGDPYSTVRSEAETRLTGELTAMQTQLQNLQNEIQLLPPADPRGTQLRNQFNTGYAQLTQRSQTAQLEAAQLLGEQAAQAYEKVYTTARGLAERLGYSHLIVTRRDGAISSAGGLAAVTQEMLARSVILAPAGDDLTERLRVEMGLPEFVDAAPAVAPAEPAPAAGGPGQ